jgi:hypothetical protein
MRAQFIMPGRSGLPEDRYITTWAFRTESNLAPTTADTANVAILLGEFYNSTTAPATASLATNISAVVNKPACEVRVYRLGDLPPRQPIITPISLGAITTSTSYPSEVAVVASFYAGLNAPRRRGRIYYGPLVAAVGTTDTANEGRVKPTTGVMTQLTTSMKRLQANAVNLSLRWCVLSQTDGTVKDITAGWCDDAFDTQRRRGEDAATRTLWTSIV